MSVALLIGSAHTVAVDTRAAGSSALNFGELTFSFSFGTPKLFLSQGPVLRI